MNKPNVIFLLTDQWRLQALGYAGNSQVKTPNIDRLAAESSNFTQAIAGWPVCSPWRASMLTGQYPLTHGVFLNDAPIGSEHVGLGEAFSTQGYDTAFIGKWHVDGRGGRSDYIPPERRLGFDTFHALECTHDYNDSKYYADNDETIRVWDGYDVFAQSDDATSYIREHQRDPFMLLLSWGPPHNPYETAPEEYRALYNPDDIQLRPNVPDNYASKAREWLAGYYAHCSAIDKSVGDILTVLDETGLADNTIVVFASDHGDMLGSQGQERKQRPWEESIRVPFLVRTPDRSASRVKAMINAHDIMPTLLGLCDLDIPTTVEGRDFSPVLSGGPDPSGEVALLACFHPFGEFTRQNGGREFRGVRSTRYTYTRTLEGPWLLYDNELDPYQLNNLIDDPAYAQVQAEHEATLQRLLVERQDQFEPGTTYIERWGYQVNENGTIDYRW